MAVVTKALELEDPLVMFRKCLVNFFPSMIWIVPCQASARHWPLDACESLWAWGRAGSAFPLVVHALPPLKQELLKVCPDFDQIPPHLSCSKNGNVLLRKLFQNVPCFWLLFLLGMSNTEPSTALKAARYKHRPDKATGERGTSDAWRALSWTVFRVKPRHGGWELRQENCLELETSLNYETLAVGNWG